MTVLALLLHSAVAGEPRILGGAPAEPGDWPTVAALFVGDTFLCTGVLVAEDVVLTAGHCSLADTVLLDTTDTTDPVLERGVASIYSHPDWATTYDVAWLRLSEPVSLPPSPLLIGCDADELLTDGASATITGYGTTDAWSTEDTTLLHAAFVPVVDADCDDPARGCLSSVSPGGELIAGGDGIDTCVGDSGGPLWVWKGETPYVAGITSRGAKPASTPCGDGGIYVRTDAVLDWLETGTGLSFERPDCDTSPANRPPTASATPLVLEPLQTGTTTIDVDDPDLDDRHSFRLLDAPPTLSVLVDDDGLVRVTDLRGAALDGVIQVEVRDDGTPAEVIALDIAVRVLEPVPAPRCATGGAPGGLGWLLLPAALLRRRPTAPSA